MTEVTRWSALSQISPAAAWYFIVSVFHFCASERKNGKRRKEESTALPKAKNADRVSSVK
jgi:hypothetical protein